MVSLFFNPKSIAIIGASADSKKFGNALTLNVLESPYIKEKSAKIYLISRGSKEIQGIKTFSSILDVSEDIDVCIILVPARFVKTVVSECNQKKVKNIIIVTGGFGEISSEGKSVENEILQECRENNTRIMGPNCVGIENLDIGLNSSFIQMPLKGNISMVAQSGSFACASFYQMEDENLGVSKFANIGNQIDVDFSEIMNFYHNDKSSNIICLYIETVKNGRKFFETVKKIAPNKPIIVQVGGRTTKGMQAASSHTGSIASNYQILKSALVQAGAIVCESLNDYISSIKALAKLPLPKGEKIAIMTNSGGSSVLFSDWAEKFGLKFTEFSDTTKNMISQHVIPIVKKTNPLDMIAGASEKEYYNIAKILFDDPEVNIVVGCSVIPPFLNIKPEEQIKGLLKAWNESNRKKPLIPLMVYGSYYKAFRDYINQENIPVFYTPYEAAYSIKILVDRMNFLKNYEMNQLI